MTKSDQQAQQTRRQVVKFTFYKLDAVWRRLPANERELGKQQFCDAIASFGDRLLIRSYSLVGTRGDADLVLWQIGDRLDDIQALQTQLSSTAVGTYLSIPYSFLAMTRRSMYVSPEEVAGGDRENRLIVQPTEAKYLFVYPFVKTRAWYKLPKEERQRMMDEHIAVGRKYPTVKLNTTYSYGLDDQEFVLSFETDEPSDFLDLVMELREAETSMYTERDTPILSCIAMSVREALDSLGAPGVATVLPQSSDSDSWTQVAELDELPEGATTVVYVQGEQVALFNVGGEIYAIGNRCSHANGPLADGKVEGTTVTCPWHNSAFDLCTGQPTQSPAVRPVPAFRVNVEGGAISIIRAQTPAHLRPVGEGNPAD